VVVVPGVVEVVVVVVLAAVGGVDECAVLVPDDDPQLATTTEPTTAANARWIRFMTLFTVLSCDDRVIPGGAWPLHDNNRSTGTCRGWLVATGSSTLAVWAYAYRAGSNAAPT
jgi:hypothetical protein